MNFMFRIFIILLFFTQLYPVLGQTVQELSLTDAISNAMQNDGSIIKTKYAIESQNSIIKTRYGSLLPNLSLTTGWSRTNQVYNNTFSIGGFNYDRTIDTTTSNYNFSLRSELLLFDGFSNYEIIDIEKMNRQVLNLQQERQQNEVALRVINTYINVLKNQQLVSINEARLEDSRQQLERIRQFVNVGKRTVTDIYKQDVQVAQFELAVEQSKNNVEKAIADLVNAAKLSQDIKYAVRSGDINADISYVEMSNYAAANSNVNLLVQRAMDNRYEVKQTLQTIKINEANLELQRNEMIFPTVTAFSNYNLSASSFGNLFKFRNFTFGLNLSYPIFQGFQISNLRQQAEINVKISEQDLEDIQNQIELDIKKSVIDLKSLLKQIEITERSLKAAEQDKTLAEVSYTAGLATLLDVQTATVQYNNALIERSNLIYNFILAQKQLEYYQGILKY